MKVLYDHQIFEQQVIGGASRYYCEIINKLTGRINVSISIKKTKNIYLNNSLNLKKLIQKSQIIEKLTLGKVLKVVNKIRKILKGKKSKNSDVNLRYSIHELQNGNFNVFHPTNFDPYFLDYIGNKAFVVTIHDMIHELFPEFFGPNNTASLQKAKLAKKASHIIAVSENTKKDIIKILNIEESKISVVYHGADSLIGNAKKIDGLPNKYLLYVGSRHGYKNFSFLIHSIAVILIEHNIHLICTSEEFNENEIELFNSLGINKYIQHCFCSDDELAYLYKNAVSFIFPSLYEGFGIPILEAFANNCPVILSNKSCFPEIAGEAAIYFDPKNKLDIQKAVLLLINSEQTREDLIAKGKERIKLFSWEKASENTLSIYKKVSST